MVPKIGSFKRYRSKRGRAVQLIAARTRWLEAACATLRLRGHWCCIGNRLGASLHSLLLDFAKRWITLDVPATAQCSKRAYGSASCVRARGFDFVTSHQQLPVRIENIR